MSKKKSVHQMYIEAWQLRRMAKHNDRIQPDYVFCGPDTWHAEYQSRSEFTGWCDPFRRNTFLILRGNRYPDLEQSIAAKDIPF